MRVVTKEEFYLEMDNFFAEIFKGAVFIYPTDTIYGIGCNAKNAKAVVRIRGAKERKDVPFSVIAPSKEWIRESCIVDDKAEEWLEKLPGPYTLVLRLKNKNCVAKDVNPKQDSLGVRMPKHWMMNVIKELGVPIVTTSVNKAGMKYMTSLDDLDESIKTNVSFMIDEGEKKGSPSNVVNLAEEGVIITERKSFPHIKKKI